LAVFVWRLERPRYKLERCALKPEPEAVLNHLWTRGSVIPQNPHWHSLPFIRTPNFYIKPAG
jgi:hypothetical protein